MTFHQWAARWGLEPFERVTFQAIWDQLISGGCSPVQARSLLDEAFDFFDRKIQKVKYDSF